MLLSRTHSYDCWPSSPAKCPAYSQPLKSMHSELPSSGYDSKFVRLALFQSSVLSSMSSKSPPPLESSPLVSSPLESLPLESSPLESSASSLLQSSLSSPLASSPLESPEPSLLESLPSPLPSSLDEL